MVTPVIDVSSTPTKKRRKRTGECYLLGMCQNGEQCRLTHIQKEKGEKSRDTIYSGAGASAPVLKEHVNLCGLMQMC